VSLATALQSLPMTDKREALATEITQVQTLLEKQLDQEENIQSPLSRVRSVPFYSQFNDISDPNWKKVGCGIASVAMLIDYYAPAVSVDALLNRGIATGAYLSQAGWTHAGLINLTKQYGLDGVSHDMAGWTMDEAFSRLEQVVAEGPVMVSVYYTFVPGHPIPHLVVINDIKDDTIYYNDPAEPSGGGSILITDFKPAWKKRYIEIRPV
jgi:hypothetical protein